MEESYVIDCSGRKVATGGKLFSAKCWVGNTADFLFANESRVIGEALAWPLARVSICMPIYRSGAEFLPSLASLLAQRWAERREVEVILYLNQPRGALEEETRRSLAIFEELRSKLSDAPKSLIVSGHELSPDGVKLRLLFEEIDGGLATVYQRSFATLIARIRRAVDQRNPVTKEEKAEALEALMSSHVFGVCDDDLIFPSTNALPDVLGELKAGESVVLGDVKLSRVQSSFPTWDETLVRLMNLFFAFKQELGSAILTPRMAVVEDLFHLPAPESEVSYADQIWFATAAAGKRKLLVPVTTSLVEESYASNAEMTARLARFLATGEESEALAIFESLVAPYETSCGRRRYSAADLRELLDTLRGGEKQRILALCEKLERRPQ